MNAGMFSSQFCHSPPSPCRNSSGGPSPPVSTTLTRRPEHHLGRASATASRPSSRSSRRRRRTSGPAAARTNALAGSARTCPMNPDTPLPYQRPCASRSTSTRRCTRTGTSSPRSPSAASASSCPYEHAVHVGDRPPRARAAQGVRRGDPQRPSTCSRAEPYPGAVETITRWHEQGHFIHITQPPRHRRARRTRASGWTQIGLPHDELYCSYDKIARCVEIGIDVLIDDSPGQPDAARVEAGYHRRDARAPVEPGPRRRHQRPGLADARASASSRVLRMNEQLSYPPRPSTAPTCPRSSPSARSPTGAAPSASRARSTRRSTSSSTTTGSGSRSRGSSTSRPPAARCWSPTTPARSRPTRR